MYLGKKGNNNIKRTGRMIMVGSELMFHLENENLRKIALREHGRFRSGFSRVFSDADQEVVWVGTTCNGATGGDRVPLPDCHTVITLDVPSTVRAQHCQFYQDTLRPLFRCFPSLAAFDPQVFSGFRMFNELFAAMLSAVVEENDTVVICDEGLMILPALLKFACRCKKVIFHCSEPIPGNDMWRLMPASWRTLLFDGMAASSVVETLSASCAVNLRRIFLRELKQLPPTEVTVQPLSSSLIDIKVAGVSDRQMQTGLKNLNGESKVILAVDTLDPSAGMSRRLAIFEKLLKAMPELKRQVTLLVRILPGDAFSLDDIVARRAIESHVSRINGEYGDVWWQPVIYSRGPATTGELVELYRLSDIALCTPLRSGSCRFAREFVAAREDRKGALILSELACESEFMTEAFLVNPNDDELVISVLGSVLREKGAVLKRRMNALRATLGISPASSFETVTV